MALEQFRNWSPHTSIKVTYKDNLGNKNTWEKNQKEFLDQIKAIVDDYYITQKIKLTNRQLYYQLVSADIIPNADEIYQRLNSFLTDARYAGEIDWDAIEDRSRVTEMPSEWDSVKDLIESAVTSFRLPRWSDQDSYIEMFCEKQALESVLQPVANRYHILFGYNKGYSSAASMYELSKRLKEKIEDDKEVVLLYFGDHDASGVDMIRDIRERMIEFLGEEEIAEMFQIIPLALTMAQIKAYKPPPNPAKITDPRAKWYLDEFGKTSWELDAIKPEILSKIAEQGILEYLDLDKYSKWIKLEKQQRKALESFGESLIKSK